MDNFRFDEPVICAGQNIVLPVDNQQELIENRWINARNVNTRNGEAV